MKIYRGNWDEDIVKYINYAYENSVIPERCCTCHFYADLLYTYKCMENSPYVTTYNGEIIHLDSIPKLCKYVCTYYY